ncbi:MAG: hypothetical protein JSS45_09370 [Proteobacteria bacterium]|nr:hypothetical protein [Pseudomonadota bacterium]
MRVPSASCLCLALLAVAASSATATATAAGARAAASQHSGPTAIADSPKEKKCTNEPRTDERDKRPRCGSMGAASAPRAYHVVGGSGDPVDQTVCDINQSFVLNGRLFGVEFSGGVDGTYKFVRTPNVPGLRWTAGGRYHIEFPDGASKRGTLTTEGGGTTTAGSQSRTTSGAEHFTLTPVAACK